MGARSRETEEQRRLVRVLYVDPTVDEPDEAVEPLLSDDRFEVEYREHTAAALDALEGGGFDCVLSEYSLVQTEVFTFLEEVRDRCPDIPLVVFTDQGSEQVASEAFAAGVADYFTKAQAAQTESLLRERLLATVEQTGTANGQSGGTEHRSAARTGRDTTTLFAELPIPAIRFEFVGDDAVVRDVNSAFTETFGFDTDVLRGRSAGVLTVPTDADRETDHEAPTAPAEPVETVVTRVTEEGPRQFRFRTIPVHGDGGTTDVFGIYAETVDHGRDEADSTLSCYRVDRTLETTATGIWSWDVAADRFAWHDGTAQLLGCEPAALGESMADLLGRVHPVDRDDLEAAFETASETGRLDTEFRVQTADGRQRWISGRGETLSNGTGERYLAGVFTDVTRHKDREAELLRYETVIEAAGDPVYVLDENGDFEFVNDAFVEMTGYGRDAVVGEHASVLLEESAIEDGEEVIRALLNSDVDRGVIECEIETEYGTERWCEINIGLLCDGGSFEGTTGTIRDITEHKQQKAELQRERDRFSALFDAVPEPVVRLRYEDENPVIREVNDEFTAVFGYEQAEVAGEPINDLIVPDEELRSACEIDRVATDGEQVTREVRREAVDGIREFLFRSVPVESENGHTEQFALYVDITERKAHERRIEQQRDDLDILNQMMQHDIRNDLQTVVAFADTLEQRLEGEPREYASRIHENAESAVDLVQSARELADAMLQDDFEQESMSLAVALEPQLDELRDTDDVVVTVDGDIPDTRVRADEMLDSVFRNLLQNAVEHNDKELSAVHVSVTEADDCVRVAIGDNGPGIPDEQEAAIFDKGNKGLDSDGTGVGLYLVTTLLDQYGGDISISDNEPEGTVFTVELPTIE
jgi:PAS domain S-box-containing protein